jgi:Ran GTPase-activating protein (RanGAP) involved in mRNA processing and transport
VCHWLRVTRPFSGIRLSDKSYGLDAAEAIQPALQQMSQLQFADLSDIIAGRPEDVAKQVLRERMHTSAHKYFVFLFVTI